MKVLLSLCAAVLLAGVASAMSPGIVKMSMIDTAEKRKDEKLIGRRDGHDNYHGNLFGGDTDHNLYTFLGKYEKNWNEFKAKFNREFKNTAEEMKRMIIFVRNLFKIEEHNKLYAMGKKSYKLGVNNFADMTHEEFLKHRNGGETCLFSKKSKLGSTYISPAAVGPLPKSVDWRTKGAVTPVKDQKQCGSCWSFSTTGSLEGQHFRKTKKLVSFSEQQLVDCSTKYGNMGCNGGLMDNAFKYIKSKGIEKESDYPYKAIEGTCKYKASKVAGNVTGFVDIPQGSETKLKEALANVGPVSVAIDASHQSFQLYSEGVYDEPDCSPDNLDHGVLAVGYGTDSNGQDYWIVKNSWNTHWGDKGYILMSRNKDNQCGIASSASYPLV